MLESFNKNRSTKIGWKDYSEESEEKIKSYRDNQEKYYNLAKMTVSNMDVTNLRSIAKSYNLEKFYAFLFVLLYNGKEEHFNYGRFTSVCFGRGAEDFQSRLATLSINKLRQKEELYQ